MKIRWLTWLLMAALLAGCTADMPQQTLGTPTTPPVTTGASPTRLETTPEQTLPETTPEPTEFVVEQGSIQDAPGTVSFQFAGVSLRCGMKVSQALVENVEIHGAVDAEVAPGCYSDEVRLRDHTEPGKETSLYLVAVNDGQESAPVRDCRIYSLAFNCEEGLGFCLGNGSFVTGTATQADILAAWGQPTYRNEGVPEPTFAWEEEKNRGHDFVELVYHQPFSQVQIILRNGVVEQVRACHSAYLYPELTELSGDYTDSDALALLSRYMDITPYADGGKGEKRDLATTIQVAGEEIAMGIPTRELPQPWRDLYLNCRGLLEPRSCMYSQFPGQEGFIFANPEKVRLERFTETLIKGIHAFNPEYTNWGYDYGTLRGFTYQGISHTGTIEDVIAALGQPYEIAPSSGIGWCFVWLHYESDYGTTVRIRVDPVTNQLMELRMEIPIKYIRHY